ncbi:MAG: anhydro-N-acetylmuramic acid kinase AnmK [Defluviitoga tunisiensis]|jgi:anhydro-N-acetylmuramic acid kinase|uniref:Anhydro-N-acetylmuramic acid kinase n=1 Tax=Defluviitoga tunisiensis TaxID=1006576 RepID=A0A0C7NZS8_DEFTU|nr:anhydro-N-acetylmuramic acid kinase AnmK [Defluviitoga tunisiensis]MDD3600236.1 anhydro-N-acetylmuramic acid kinase AnmK [Defluviitoga tunisiensis]MDY0380137.1 anhydro-N-acetylmuramic acid kinase AnmK [Defluviitoga tunisiensis]CEP78783.1 Anhydro-N-acetylmuramic acid kinase [Defluviitoga tunisiensis]HHV01120.1 anhydro-N-acetylmuramic acid kinase [Defluviitoga tunisiensis]HOB54864.1 anhydro-N-acetylmuramic acid kinase AnmK [Defluviitoga tunisiensis]
MYVVGLMSGTSLDGIDTALIDISEISSNDFDVKVINFINTPYDNLTRNKILECCDPKTGSVDKICRLNFELGELFAKSVEKIASLTNIKLSNIELIGSHGQTIYHDVENDYVSSLQIGEAGVIAQRTGITTISNFRARDIAAGGQGAPLVPYVDYILFKSNQYNRVLQNIGGIGNYTYIPKNGKIEDIQGTDTGPGNMLIDGVIQILTNGEKTFDKDGEMAIKGTVSTELLNELKKHPFISKKAPKTTGREAFGLNYARKIVNIGKELHLSNEDIIATVTNFTAFTIVDAYQRFIRNKIDQIIISGGGSYNPTLILMIKSYVKMLLGENVVVMILEQLGYSSDAKEAVAFAILAYQTFKRRCNNVPQITGAKYSVILGDITP